MNTNLCITFWDIYWYYTMLLYELWAYMSSENFQKYKVSYFINKAKFSLICYIIAHGKTKWYILCFCCYKGCSRDAILWYYALYNFHLLIQQVCHDMHLLVYSITEQTFPIEPPMHPYMCESKLSASESGCEWAWYPSRASAWLNAASKKHTWNAENISIAFTVLAFSYYQCCISITLSTLGYLIDNGH